MTRNTALQWFTVFGNSDYIKQCVRSSTDIAIYVILDDSTSEHDSHISLNSCSRRGTKIVLILNVYSLYCATPNRIMLVKSALIW